MKNCLLVMFITSFTNICFSQIQFEEIDINCLNLSKVEGHIIIKDNAEYEKLYSYLSPHSECESYTFPEINFQQDILIGVKVEASGCERPQWKLKLSKEDGACALELSIPPTGMCKKLFSELVWILVKNSDCPKTHIKTVQK
jgi:hypothetical protein